jgi:hypothetical protein
MPQRRKAATWTGLWPFAIVAAFFLLGLWGHGLNAARNETARAGNSPPPAPTAPSQGR